MALVHFNPGYHDPVSRLKRVKSAYPILQNQTRIDSLTLDDIKQRAKEVWSRPDTGRTTYRDHYNDKAVEVDEPTIARPTSTTRKNKPHPPLVFLNCRMQSVPGYHNADSTLGKGIYKVDASLPSGARHQRAQLRAKYVSQVNPAAVNQYKTNEYVERFHDPIERQAVQALINLNPQYVSDMQRGHVEREIEMQPRLTDYIPESPPHWRRPPSIAANNRYLRMAGATEADKIKTLRYQTYSNFYPQTNSYQCHTLGSQRNEDFHNMGQSKYVHKPKRGDFLMHPEWPPSIPHHRLNGLSSVDIPYKSGRR